MIHPNYDGVSDFFKLQLILLNRSDTTPPNKIFLNTDSFYKIESKDAVVDVLLCRYFPVPKLTH